MLSAGEILYFVDGCACFEFEDVILFNHGVVVQPRCFLSAGIGLRQNLLILASVRARDRVRKFSFGCNRV